MVKRQTSECCRTIDWSRHNGPPRLEPPNENSSERGYNRPLASRYSPPFSMYPIIDSIKRVIASMMGHIFILHSLNIL